jgi:predicted nucleic acid-binding protein
VKALLESGEAAWCPPIQLELWNGARGAREKRVVTETAYDLARKSRALGHTVPATDLMIAACARRYGVGLEHADAHLTAIQDL